jgi:plasmid stabilization system protein ParE
MTGYDFHPEVENDFAEIWDFIAEDSPTAADNAIADILDTIEALVPFPHQGYRRPDLTGRPLRFTNKHNYLIAYAPDEKPLWVVAVISRQPQPARDGRDLGRQGVSGPTRPLWVYRSTDGGLRVSQIDFGGDGFRGERGEVLLNER